MTNDARESGTSSTVSPDPGAVRRRFSDRGMDRPERHVARITIVGHFFTLRWRILRGGLQAPGAQRWTVLIGLVSSMFIGVAGGIGLAAAGRLADDPASLFVIAPSMIVLFVTAIGVIAGVSQPIDPRVLATEPLTNAQLSVGLLTGSAVGPPGISAALLGVGLFVGAVRSVVSVPVIGLAVLTLMATLLLISRAMINALGLFAVRYPRAGQITVGVVSLVFYGGFQFIPQLAGGLDANEQQDLANVLAFTPPGQLGRAIGSADTDPLVAMGHIALGSLWLVPLAWVFTWTTRRLIVSVKRDDLTGGEARATLGQRRQPISTVARRLCGSGPVGAVAWRGILTRLRTPRSALETFTGAGVGLALILVPTLVRDGAGSGAVLVGGAVQLSVLFMAGNSFGSDGPALSNELLCGVDPGVLVRGKARSIAVVAAPIAVIGPVVAAAITGEWAIVPAGFLVGMGGLLAGTGGAIVQSTVVPIAIPEGDNPLASGDTGKGCFAGVILAAIVAVLGVVSLPVAIALRWALGTDSIGLIMLLGVVTVAVGWLVYQQGIGYATKQWRLKEPELYEAVIPAR